MIRNPAFPALLLIAFAVSTTLGAGGGLSGVNPASGAERTIDLDARVTHVVFFAIWCPPCLAEFAAIRDLAARWEPEGYRLILVAIDQRQSEERIARFITDRQPPGTVLYDRGGALQARFGLDAVPGHLLLGSGGAELFRASALDEGVAEALERHLESR